MYWPQTLLVGRQKEHPACKKTEWWGAGMVICLERGADLHMAQLMPLPLTVSCFSKIQIGFTFRYRPTRVFLEKRPLNGCVCIGLRQHDHDICWPHWSATWWVILSICLMGQTYGETDTTFYYRSSHCNKASGVVLPCPLWWSQNMTFQCCVLSCLASYIATSWRHSVARQLDWLCPGQLCLVQYHGPACNTTTLTDIPVTCLTSPCTSDLNMRSDAADNHQQPVHATGSYWSITVARTQAAANQLHAAAAYWLSP